LFSRKGENNTEKTRNSEERSSERRGEERRESRTRSRSEARTGQSRRRRAREEGRGEDERWKADLRDRMTVYWVCIGSTLFCLLVIPVHCIIFGLEPLIEHTIILISPTFVLSLENLLKWFVVRTSAISSMSLLYIRHAYT